MCQLMGMSANVPTDAIFSFTGLVQRGGGTDIHQDGWGIVFYRGKGIQTFKDPEPSVASDIASLVSSHPIRSETVISHIRQANVGGIGLENTHPFCRELWGRNWTFAHNGQLDAERFVTLPLGQHRPIGTTDSEHAFCWLLKCIADQCSADCEDEIVWDVIHHCAKTLHVMGVSNFLLSDGRFLVAHCSNRLNHITRRAPFGKATLKDVEMRVDFGTETTPKDIVTVIATEPLTTDEEWQAMDAQELLVFSKGEIISRYHTALTPESPTNHGKVIF